MSIITVLEEAVETRKTPVTRVRAEDLSSAVEAESSSGTGTGGAGSGCFSTTGGAATGGVIAAAGVGAGVCGFAGGEWRNFHHTPAPNARTNATSRTITVRAAVDFC